jgi:Lrp/AsnC family transcriptional regulator, leucine-responsive regulatory protein
MLPTRLDEIDIKILHHLQREARISNVELANRVGLSPAPCLRRVKALEDAGVIRKYVALLDPHALNLNVTVLVQISLDRQVAERFHILEEAILDRPEVLECYVTTGPSDFLMRVVVKDVAAYEQFQREFLSRIESVAATNSSFALKQVKYFTEFPLSYASTGKTPVAEPDDQNGQAAHPRRQAIERTLPAARRPPIRAKAKRV